MLDEMYNACVHVRLASSHYPLLVQGYTYGDVNWCSMHAQVIYSYS